MYSSRHTTLKQRRFNVEPIGCPLGIFVETETKLIKQIKLINKHMIVTPGINVLL